MKTWIVLTHLTVVFMLTATPVLARTGGASPAQPAPSRDRDRSEPSAGPELYADRGRYETISS